MAGDRTDAVVRGDVDEGFGAVADAFRSNLVDRNEVGGACAVYRDGRAVVDLWGGFRDAARTLPWGRDTLVPVFSTTKGMASIAMAVAHSRGLFELDDLVTRHWPEFGQNGKGAITVRQLLTHQAGLAVIDAPISIELLGEPDALGEVLAAQPPKWEPGEFHGLSRSVTWLVRESAASTLRSAGPDYRPVFR